MARPRKYNKSANKRGAPRRPQKGKQGFPFLALAIALLLSGFIGYVIFATDEPVAVKKVYKAPPKKEERLPQKPKSKWQYEQSLPSKEVIVEIPEANKKTVPYAMQCGSFKRKSDAESLKANIAFQGLQSTIKKTTSWHRVVLGPYETKRLAEKDRHKLQRAHIDGCKIWHWR